jgi:hypothetical protein
MTNGAEELDDILDPVGEVPIDGPPLSELLPKGYLSVSQATLFIKCAHQWYLKYVERGAIRVKRRMIEGSNVHAAVEKILTDKKETGKVPALDVALDAFSTAFEQSKATIDDWEGVNQGEAKDNGVKLTRLYFYEGAPKATPLQVEEDFRVDLTLTDGEKLPIVGRIDSVQVQLDRPEIEYDPKAPQLQKLPRRVHDLKVTTNKWGPDKLKNDLQFHVYAHVTGVPDVQVDQLVKGRAQVLRPHYEVDKYSVTPQDTKHAVNVLEGVAKSITRGNFPLTDPSSWWCSEDWCPMWASCRGRNK